MITDLFNYLLNETRTTSTTIVAMILFEIFLVLLYFALPIWLSNPAFSHHVNVLESMVFLDTEYVIANSNLFHVQAPGTQLSRYNFIANWMSPATDLPPITFNQSYSLSFWVYVNPHSLSNSVPVFNYGQGKPALYFASDEQTGYFLSVFTNINSDKHTYGITLPFQKWNYFVYTYVNGTCELYINGELVYIDQLGADLPTYAVTDTMVLGQNHGLYGSICNINYYKDPLSPATIVTTYNLLSMQNPPIFITTTVDTSQSWYDYLGLNYLLLRDNTV